MLFNNYYSHLESIWYNLVEASFRQRRTSLVAARRNKEKGLIVPMRFTGSLHAEGFERWLKEMLLLVLTMPSIVMMDTAPLHRKSRITTMIEAAGHHVLFVPKCSPDLNDIEHDVRALKRARMDAGDGKTLAEIVRDYCSS